MSDFIYNKIASYCRNRNWKRSNPRNSTVCANVFDHSSVSVGNYTYGPLTILNFGKGYKAEIGSFCSIASGVVFNLAGDHPINRVSSFPFKAKILGGELTEAVSKGDIIVGDDVWIGQNAIILSGVHIGQGAVIAAGAVIASDVPPYAIMGGVPGKVIKFRFEKEIIEYMLTLNYSELTEELIRKNIDALYTEIDDLSIEKIQEMFKWFPKKTCIRGIV